MVDFVEYVVSELSSKRLSKANALALITQFRSRPKGASNASVIHPLLHRNTSDLTRQSYATTFDGSEFFLRDHCVDGRKVLPAVAYLEMVRCAVRHAMPAAAEACIELRNVVWAQPIVVAGRADVSVALFPTPDGIDYEVHGVETGADGSTREIVHSRGLVLVGEEAAPARLDVAQLRARTAQRQLDASRIYAAYEKMGIVYGPTHQGVTTIHQGDGQVFAQLRLPAMADQTLADYLLHPSLMDAAIQSAIGFVDDIDALPDRPNLPFALESVRVLSACTRDMFAWLRLSAGSTPGDSVVKLDIDLCDPDGKVCVQMRGFTSRVLGARAATGVLYAAPVWEPRPIGRTDGASPRFERRHIVLCGAHGEHAEVLAATQDADCLPLPGDAHRDPAQRYQQAASACFERIKGLLSGAARQRVLLQLVVPDTEEDALVLGLSGLLKTAAAENPAFSGQIIVASPRPAEALAQLLRADMTRTRETVIRHRPAAREVLTWKELEAGEGDADIAFKDGGVYLITGGLGGLGVLFAREILEKARGAKVVVTGRSALTPEKDAILKSLSSRRGAVEYRPMDVADAGQVRQVVAAIVEEHQRLDGILHAAGMIRDAFILEKTVEDLRQVLEPKVAGTFHLDEASKQLALDFMVLFSAGAAVTGNPGQADYAAANGFMDRFATYRNQLASQGLRQGRTRAIDWPLWQEGGMRVDAAILEQVRRSAGLTALRTIHGLQAFHRSLALPHDQLQVVEGDLPKLRERLFADAAGADLPTARQTSDAETATVDPSDLQDRTRQFLKKRLSALLKLPANRIDAAAPLEKYGINSIMTMDLTNELEKIFGSLPKTLFFEYQTLDELAQYFIRSHAARLATLFAPDASTDRRVAVAASAGASKAAAEPVPDPSAGRSAARRRRFAAIAPSEAGQSDAARLAEPIAIVGLSGRYPGARNVEEYWRNLRDGKDCIVEVPADRWDWRDYFSDDRSRPGHHYSKWGGFIDGVDEFDALFFNIPPADAERIDPQERLFLQHAWMALEDAGYTRASLQGPRGADPAGQVGVYVGVMYGEYQMFGAEASLLGNRTVTPSSYASIANRVSYFLNLHGPSLAVDTMCSSSLTAIQLACQDLKQGRTDVAIAGGVNVTIHPNKYLLLSAGQFIASDGRCQSFGEGGDGYIPAEGVGAVVLKRLSQAQRDGNHIWGVIKGSALNHGGKTNGYSVPNPQAQAGVIAQALKEAEVDPRHISYVEAHGTGTRLGDPIEIAALTQVYRRHTPEHGFCLIGSAKSNIGHAESAAGIAGLTKVLLQMKHRTIVPSLHSAALNPHIDFDSTPFVVNQALRAWEQPEIGHRRLPRIAGISSFGAGGSNAHLVVEEYTPADSALPPGSEDVRTPLAILLSARTPEQLEQKIRDLLAFLQTQQGSVDLQAVAWTLQAGREAMQERIGLIVQSVEQLAERLQAHLGGEQDIEGCHRGQATRGNEVLALFGNDADLQETLGKWMAGRKLARLLELWTQGLDIDWSGLWGERKPRFISLPTYPFARERCWIDRVSGGAFPATASAAVLHPLVHANASDFTRQRYRSTFSGAEFFLADHRVRIGSDARSKVLPGVAYLEMARSAIANALPHWPEAAMPQLRNVAWTQPLIVSERRQVEIGLSAGEEGQIDFEIVSERDGSDIVHCQGLAVVAASAEAPTLDVARLAASLQRGAMSADDVYAAYARMGLEYGPAHRAIVDLSLGDGQLLARLRLPKGIEANLAHYLLHPSLMDAAVQAAIGLFDTAPGEAAQARLPFALDSMHILAPCTADMLAWVRFVPGHGASAPVTKLDIDVCDGDGRVCVQMRGFSSRALGQASAGARDAARASATLLAAPAWRDVEVSGAATRPAFEQHHVVLCDLPGIDAEQLEAQLPASRCQALTSPVGATIAARYSHQAVAIFKQLRTLFEADGQGRALIQIVLEDSPEQAVSAGLAGMLRTAALESPQITGQVVLAAPGTSAAALARQLRDNIAAPDTVVRYASDRSGVRQALRWEEIRSTDGGGRVAFKEHGVYLITGGLGGLGMLFAKEILARTSRSKIVLTGRSVPTPGQQACLEALPSGTGRIDYRTLDIESADAVKQLIDGVIAEHGRLDGILHSAGMTADNFIVKKSSDEFARVLAPKVTGSFHLDAATRDVDLDWLVLFSSASGAMGNVGQADYAAANGFMDHFAAYRNRLAANAQRRGRTVSINWPLWQDGGMRIDDAMREMLERATGVVPMPTACGMEALHRSLVSAHDEVLVLEGDPQRLRALIAPPTLRPDAAPSRAVVAAPMEIPAKAGGTPADSLREQAEDYLRHEFSDVLKLPSHKIDPKEPLENYGIDSVVAMRLSNQLEKTFGSLSKTLFFEYQTIARLAGHLAEAFPDVLRQLADAGRVVVQAPPARSTTAERQLVPAVQGKSRFLAGTRPAVDREVAIVGLSGRYPMARDLDEFWENLKAGRDCISEIPAERWDHALYFDADRNKAGKTYAKWGGFLADVDKFDPLFFNISPKEAEVMDPQERLFLQTAWQTLEDAGYGKDALSGKRVGVYVGAMWGHYELFGAAALAGQNRLIPTSSHASIANRVSYFFDFHGPSIALDTMCSSSLTAIHLACEEIRRGHIDAALAGGVNLSIHPQKYLNLSQGRFAASDGRCRSFGAGGDGYVPGEGVGAVLLKPLEDALRDGDRVYAVIRASAVNHGGKTNGYTVPNPNAQGELILETLKAAKIDPRTIGYIETHGTGTALGDPIEITGLQRAFGAMSGEPGSCPIGSVKSNIGHLESAAGIAAVTKALLQIRHGQLVPSLHAEPPNPNIDFANSPFRVQSGLTEWKRPADHPRRVAVSSFGAGGSNAHMILEEFADARPDRASAQPARREVFLLSARDDAALRRYALRMAAFLARPEGESLTDLAFTSQIGRTPMPARLAVIAASVDELGRKLEQWAASRSEAAAAREPDDVFQGDTHAASVNAGHLIQGAAGKAFLDDLLDRRDLEKVARLWTVGADIDWPRAHRDRQPRKVNLPTYPFATERYWIDTAPSPAMTVASAVVPAPAPVEDKRRMCFRPQWTASPLAALTLPLASTGPVLILDASDEFAQAIRARLADRPIVLARFGSAFAETARDDFTIAPGREEDFDRVVEALEQRGQLPQVILHRYTDALDADGAAQADGIERQLDHGVIALLHVCKALMKRKHHATTKLLSFFSGGPQAVPPGVALAGFCRTLHLENPRYLPKVIEIRCDAVDRAGAIAEEVRIVLDELRGGGSAASEIRYEGQAGSAPLRHVLDHVPALPVEARSAGLPLKQHGVYLVTGGLGGLGFIVADYLAKNFGAKLVLVGRSAHDAHAGKIAALEARGAETLHLRGDVASLADMQAVVREAKARFGRIDGVIHSAGSLQDAYILKKTRADFIAVLEPKVQGAMALDRATCGEKLDLFVLFSSVAGALGNPGQGDYAYANRFLDAFAEAREQARASGQRSGRTLAIDWPYWEEGGMSLPHEVIAAMTRNTGIHPLPTSEGIRFLEDLLRSGWTQAVALYGEPSKLALGLGGRPAPARVGVPVAPANVEPATLRARAETYLKQMIGAEIRLDPERIDARERFDAFGIDSIMVGNLNERLSRDLGELPKTLFYEHETLADLAQYLALELPQALASLLGANEVPAAADERAVRDAATEAVAQRPEIAEQEPIAIIGVHGYYPQAQDLDEYWRNLKEGVDVVGAVPAARWDAERFYDADPDQAGAGKIYCKSGAFLEDVDRFDAAFFNIDAREARAIDPQERLFLQSVWSAVEDAGYTRESLRRRHPKGRSADVGVFVGVTTNTYQLLANEEWQRGNAVAAGSLPWSIANRVSYCLDFQGPSMPVDTACSSSSVAIHLACESLRRQECQVAVAGGVNLYLHPSKYHGLCSKRMLAQAGRCRSFGAGDDGFVPGEAVGTLILKPLSRARADGDRIHAVIRGSAVDHSGKSNGYLAPNPNSQARVIARAMENAGVHAESIGYVEGHGTGTQLGDSLEIVALTQAFGQQTEKRQFCPIGSVKANLGHPESAAGIAGVTKVLLQMKHRALAPTIHSDDVNPNIDFERSPFFLQHGLRPWDASPGHPRQALVNSFGAGGVNACIVLQEWEPPAIGLAPAFEPQLVVLSARTPERLREYARKMLDHLRREADVDLASLAYTLQAGREAMPERLALVVRDVRDVCTKLEAWISGGHPDGAHRGSLDARKGSPKSSKQDIEATAALLDDRRLDAVGQAWVAGAELDWERLHGAHPPARISLPTYPFARDRHWIADAPAQPPAEPRQGAARLHPLLSHNSSTLREVSFSAMLSGSAFYARDHRVNGQRIFPGAGFLEMACVAGELAGTRKVRKIRDIVFIQPLAFTDDAQLVRISLTPADEDAGFIVTSYDANREKVVHSEGVILFDDGATGPASEEQLPLERLKQQCPAPTEGAGYYDLFEQAGIHYGPAFRTMQELYLGPSFALSRLVVAEDTKTDFDEFVLHPCLIDGALQTVSGLAGRAEASVPYLPFAIDEIEILRPLSRTCHVHVEEVEATRRAGGAEVRKFHVRIANDQGLVSVSIRNFCVRAFRTKSAAAALAA